MKNDHYRANIRKILKERQQILDEAFAYLDEQAKLKQLNNMKRILIIVVLAAIIYSAGILLFIFSNPRSTNQNNSLMGKPVQLSPGR